MLRLRILLDLFHYSRSFARTSCPATVSPCPASTNSGSPPGIEGLPLTEPLRQGAIGLQDWNVLRADMFFPIAMLKESALLHNLAWTRDSAR